MSSLAKIEWDWLAAPEAAPRAVSLCCVCAEPISEGESYWDTAAGDVCCDCLDGMTAAAFLEDVCCEKINIATKD